MDSPLSNAISHYANLVLFWLGDAFTTTARPLAVEAELYRANAIENYDTCALRIRFPGDITALIYFTHACQRQIDPQITITGTRGTLTTGQGRTIVLRDEAGSEIERFYFTEQRHVLMVRQFAGWVQGDPAAEVVATLEQAEPHLIICNGASEATAIRTVPASEIEVVAGRGGTPLHTIRGIEEAFTECARRGQLPSESGLVSWSVAAGRRDLREYRHFAGPR
jgi:predicted dehydrogenase